MRALFSPRFLLIVWGGIGAAVLVYVIVASSVKPGTSSAAADPRNTAYLVGAMEKFAFAQRPRPAPKTLFQRGDQPATLSDFRGRAVLVNFWATWCAPCLKELPSLDALQGELGGDQFSVVAIAADPRGAEEAKAFLDRLKIRNLEFYADPQLRLAAELTPGVLPVSILYDRKGREVGRLVGEADWSSPEARRLIEATIAAK
jgi:thiol-disulfide isomerase/thioredoxin